MNHLMNDLQSTKRALRSRPALDGSSTMSAKSSMALPLAKSLHVYQVSMLTHFLPEPVFKVQHQTKDFP